MNIVQAKLVPSFSLVAVVAITSLTALVGCEDAATVSQLDTGAGADSAVDAVAGSDVAVAETDTAVATDTVAQTDAAEATDAAAETDVVAATDVVATTDAATGTDASGPDTSTTCSSAEKKACNDGLTCTIDTCTMPGAVCSWKLAEDTCLIGGVCRGAGEAKANDPCQVCDPTVSQSAWSAAAVGAPCDDGDLCTYDGSCQDVTMGPATKTVCVSKTTPCDDGNGCTTDTCSPKTGCAYPAAKGKACDDGDACTSGDACGLSGACTGTTIVCNDNNLCTDDACDLATGCTTTANSAPCSDNDACTSGDVCSAGKCATGAAANCDDGNTCTLDICDKQAGCYHLPVQTPCCTGQTNVCDDGNPCTTEDCDPNTGGCGTPAPNTALCNDNNACTQSDTCTGGSCKGVTTVCNDNNPCTNDACTPSSGCVFSNADGVSCNDGDDCTSTDLCAGGSCKGSGKCDCVPVFSDQVSKLTSILIGSGGKPGQGLDLDNNPATCAPSADCAGGINNSLGSLAGFANGPLDDAVAGGSVTILLEYLKLQQGPVDVALYLAKQDFTGPPCDAALMSCQYLVDPSLYVFPTCSPLVSLPGTLAGNVLLAGGPGTNFPFSLPLSAGVDLNITIYGARIQGTVVITDGKVVSIDAILAGAVPKTSLLAAVEALPEEGLPIPKDGIKGILESVVENDIDSDGDGTKDAASIGLKIKGIQGVIVGLQP
jgi:hypothetical protein